MSDLKDALVPITKIQKNRMVIADVYNYHIYQTYHNYISIDQITDDTHTFVYELPTDEEVKSLLFEDYELPKDVRFKVLPLYHQCVKDDFYSGLINEDVGIPLLMKVPVDYAMDALFVYSYIAKMIGPYLQNVDKWDP